MILGLMLTTSLNENEYEFVIIIITFIVLTVVHVVANYYAVKSLQLKTLNRERLNIVISHYLDESVVMTPAKVCNFENVWKVNLLGIDYLFNSKKDRSIRLSLGTQINDILPAWMEWNLNRKKQKDIRYFIGVSVEYKVCHINIAYDVRASDADFIESFLLYRIIKEWTWKQIQCQERIKAFIAPNASLKVFTQK